MDSNKGTILLTNDDGYSAEGIKYLYTVLSKHYDVIVVAPQKEQSGVGHAFTFNTPLHYEKIPESFGMKGFFVYGTPSDCVKFAISYLLPQRPDIIVSGMNMGENSGLSAHYSGTVAAAREGAFWKIPSFAFSICIEAVQWINDYASIVPQILEGILLSAKRNFALNSNTFFNINFPPCSLSDIKGTKVAWQSVAYFDDRYERIEVESHHTKEGFMIYGEKKDIEISNAFDSRALMNNHITITPLTFDTTAHEVLPHLRWLEEEDFTKR